MRRFMRRTSYRTTAAKVVVLVLFGATACWSTPAVAQTGGQPTGQILARGSHTVTLGVRPITVLAVSGNPMPFILASSRRTADASTFYSLTTNVDNVLLEAALDLPLPTGARLEMNLSSTLGRSHRWTDISNGLSAAVLVSNLKRGLENGQRIRYRVTIDGDISDMESPSRTIALTLRDPVSGHSHTVYQTIFVSLHPDIAASVVE